MCASCGCGEIDENHGDERNITMRDLERAAEATGIGVDEVVENLRESVEENMAGAEPAEPNLSAE